ncbi:MAG: winged helix-turn-helix domain-containing protein [Carboxydocellales bacterium]
MDANSIEIECSGLKPKTRIWIEIDGEVVFGGGRMALFEAIEQYGSIRQAATNLGMSYRAAWGKIKATEERLGIKLVDKHTGGHQSGAALTPEAKEMLILYRRFKEDSVKAVDSFFVRYFSNFLPKA